MKIQSVILAIVYACVCVCMCMCARVRASASASASPYVDANPACECDNARGLLFASGFWWDQRMNCHDFINQSDCRKSEDFWQTLNGFEIGTFAGPAVTYNVTVYNTSEILVLYRGNATGYHRCSDEFTCTALMINPDDAELFLDVTNRLVTRSHDMMRKKLASSYTDNAKLTRELMYAKDQLALLHIKVLLAVIFTVVITYGIARRN